MFNEKEKDRVYCFRMDSLTAEEAEKPITENFCKLSYFNFGDKEPQKAVDIHRINIGPVAGFFQLSANKSFT